MKRTLVSMVLGLALLFGVVAGPMAIGEALNTAPSADAASTRTNYVTAPKWYGWCTGGVNGVRSITVTRINGGQWWSAGDRVTVQLTAGWQQLNVAVNCKWSTPIGVNVWVRSDRSGQAHFIGYPGGSWSN